MIHLFFFDAIGNFKLFILGGIFAHKEQLSSKSISNSPVLLIRLYLIRHIFLKQLFKQA